MSHWFLCTWNKPSTDAWLQLTTKWAPTWIIGQREIGEQGTEHLQFTVYFKEQQRFSGL